MASGYSKHHTGSFTGLSATEITIGGVNFRPRAIKVYSSNGDEAFWHEDMGTSGSSMKRVAAGTNASTSNMITPTNDGFTLGTDGFNTTGRTYYYMAFD